MVLLTVLLVCAELGRLFSGIDRWPATTVVQQNTATHAADRPSIGGLREAFRKAKRARPTQLVGVWVEITNVSTEAFLTGRPGPDHVLFDITGIRPGDPPGRPLDWTLTFRIVRADELQVTSATAWLPTGDTSSVTFDSNGDFTFKKDYGGDAHWIYRCRAVNTKRLVCLLQNHADGHGVEFVRRAK